MPPLRIGLMRHFEVTKPMPSGWRTARELAQWKDDYDLAQVIPKPVDLGGIPWQRCLSSDLSRALTTAEAAYRGEITKLPQLREVNLGEFNTGSLRLPVGAWRWVMWAAWLTSHHSQAEAKSDIERRIRHVREEIFSPAREDTLIVAHAWIMGLMRKELLNLGFTGPKFRIPEHAKLYVFERAMNR